MSKRIKADLSKEEWEMIRIRREMTDGGCENFASPIVSLVWVARPELYGWFSTNLMSTYEDNNDQKAKILRSVLGVGGVINFSVRPSQDLLPSLNIVGATGLGNLELMHRLNTDSGFMARLYEWDKTRRETGELRQPPHDPRLDEYAKEEKGGGE